VKLNPSTSREMKLWEKRGPRYKALGNGMARPVVSWILRRILENA
jgi:site-specific DNA-cytosine methylase